FVMTTHVDQDPAKLRPYGLQRLLETIAGSQNCVADIHTRPRRRPPRLPARRRGTPVGGDARAHLGVPEIARKTFPRVELRLGDRRLAAAVLAAAQPLQRTLAPRSRCLARAREPRAAPARSRGEGARRSRLGVSSHGGLAISATAGAGRE